MTPLRIFIGYDSREVVAFHVLAQSIIRHSSRPVAIVPLVQSQLRAAGVYTREPDPGASTEFSLTRFLVPYLSGFEGVSVFMDCDMVARVDLAGLASLRTLEFDRSVYVVKHDYTPRPGPKMGGKPQAAYPRKNWSSLIVFKNERCRELSLAYVNRATPADLHRFAWLPDDEIGALPLDLNWLVGEYEPNPAAKVLHYTLGGPWIRGLEACDHAEDWYRERELMLAKGA